MPSEKEANVMSVMASYSVECHHQHIVLLPVLYLENGSSGVKLRFQELREGGGVGGGGDTGSKGAMLC